MRIQPAGASFAQHGDGDWHGGVGGGGNEATIEPPHASMGTTMHGAGAMPSLQAGLRRLPTSAGLPLHATRRQQPAAAAFAGSSISSGIRGAVRVAGGSASSSGSDSVYSDAHGGNTNTNNNEDDGTDGSSSGASSSSSSSTMEVPYRRNDHRAAYPSAGVGSVGDGLEWDGAGTGTAVAGADSDAAGVQQQDSSGGGTNDAGFRVDSFVRQASSILAGPSGGLARITQIFAYDEDGGGDGDGGSGGGPVALHAGKRRHGGIESEI